MATRQLPDLLDAYLEYTKNQESPELLHFWSMLGVMAAGVGRKVWIARPTLNNLHPNLMICIIANSARVRKSAAISLAFRMLKKAIPNVVYIEDRVTPEALVDRMRLQTASMNGNIPTLQAHSTMFMYQDELSTLFGHDKIGASRMSTLLTRLYDCGDKYMHTTLTGGAKSITEPCITMLSATAPEGLATIPTEASGGFLGRLVPIHADKKKRVIAWPPPANDILEQSIITDLNSASQLQGEFSIEPTAMSFYEIWYKQHDQISSVARETDAFYARCPDLVLKLAMLTSISRGDSLIINEGHMQAGTTLVAKIIPELQRASVWLKPDPFSQILARVEDIVRGRGKISRGELMSLTRISFKMMDELESTLEQRGAINISQVGKDRIYTWIP